MSTSKRALLMGSKALKEMRMTQTKLLNGGGKICIQMHKKIYPKATRHYQTTHTYPI